MAIPEEFRSIRNPGYFRPWRTPPSNADNGSTINLEKDSFQLNLNVNQFKPEELTVMVTGNNEITIEGKHEEHGIISKHFVRQYIVPQGCNMEGVVSHLSSDGVLTISAPNLDTSTIDYKEIPITQTGKPAIKSDEQKK